MDKRKLKVVECPKLWTELHDQISQSGDKQVSVSKLVSKAANLTPYELPIYHMALPSEWLNNCSMIQIVGHIKMINDADLTKPIILDQDGDIADGRHRLAKALLLGHKTILAVRIEHGAYD